MSMTRDYEWDVCIDLETLSTAPDAAILSIGAWPFRLDAQAVPVEPFYRNVRVERGGRADDGAVRWWLQQSDEARHRLIDPVPESLDDVLDDLNAWLRRIDAGHRYRLWSHGAAFDVPILESAWRRARYDDVPWRYNAVRDTRTLFHVAGLDWDAAWEQLGGVSHDALDDARKAATLVKRAWWHVRPLPVLSAAPASEPPSSDEGSMCAIEAMFAGSRP